MNENEKNRLLFDLQKKYGPNDRKLPGFYTPKAKPEKKYATVKAIWRSVKDFFTLKQFGEK